VRALATLALLAGCGGSRLVEPPGPPKFYVVDSVTLPFSSFDFAFDYGDGRLKDRMGNMLGDLTSYSGSVVLDPQGAVDSAIATGDFRPIIELIPNDDLVSTDVVLADSDPSLSSATFYTPSSGSRFASPDPRALVEPPVLSLRLPFLDGDVAPSFAVHIELYLRGNVIKGQLNVALSNDTVARVVVPALALLGTKFVRQNTAIEALFDTGGVADFTNISCTIMTACSGGAAVGSPACKNPSYGPRANACADQCDGIIDTCEVATNSLVSNLLAPDLTLFASDGTWHPQDSGYSHRDSLSFGFGFTAKQVQ
jgi:hypothetical protein